MSDGVRRPQIETGFYYLQSRYYDPSIGRFINADAAEVVTLSTAHLDDTNLFAYCRNSPVSHGDDDGNFINTVVGAFVGGLVAAVTTDRSDPNYVEKVFLGAFTGAISGLAVDIAIASAGTAVPLIIAACGGALSAGTNTAVTQKMDTGTIDWGIVAVDATIGAGLNLLAYGASIPQNRSTSGGTYVTRIIQNSNNAMQAGAVKTVSSSVGRRAVPRANYNTIIAKNKSLAYGTSTLIGFTGWAYSKKAQKMMGK